MYRLIYLLPLLFLSALPTFGYCATNPPKTYLITKDKLKCLYKQIDSLLKEPDPTIVFLTGQCDQLQVQDNPEERTSLPVPKPKIGPNPTLKPEDVLILSRGQLQCFKQAFDKLMTQTADPISIRFTSTCAIDNNYRP